jgi:hypothetical protein
MNRIYDKLALALAVLILLSGVGYYLIKSDVLLAVQSPLRQAVDAAYIPLPVGQSTEVEAVWPEAEEQAPGELYDVFTPPKIYVDSSGTFQFTPPYEEDAVEPLPPLDVYFADVQRKAYRIQLEGFIEEDLNDASKSLLLLFNEETGRQVRARVGDQKDEAEFKLLDFSIERLRDAQGNPYKVVKAMLLDLRSGEEVVLTHGERLMTDEITLVLRSDKDPSVEIELDTVPAEFETAAGQCVLQEFNLAESYVLVERLHLDLLEVETERLYLRDAPAAPTFIEPTVEAMPATDEGSQFFDFEL